MANLVARAPVDPTAPAEHGEAAPAVRDERQNQRTSLDRVLWSKAVRLGLGADECQDDELRIDVPSGSTIRALECIADHWNPSRGYAWPSVERIASESLCSTRAVKQAIRWGVSCGYITVKKAGRNNHYFITWEKADALRNVPRKGQNSGAIGADSCLHKGADSCPLLESSLSESKNNIGATDKVGPQGAQPSAKPIDDFEYFPGDDLGRAETLEAAGSGFDDKRAGEIELDRDELPSERMIRQRGRKPRFGTREHDIWRLQRRAEGMAQKVGETVRDVTELDPDALAELLDCQRTRPARLSAALFFHLDCDGWSYDSKAAFFGPSQEIVNAGVEDYLEWDRKNAAVADKVA